MKSEETTTNIKQAKEQIQNASGHRKNCHHGAVKNVISGLGFYAVAAGAIYCRRLKRTEICHRLKGLIYSTDGYGTFPVKMPDYDAAFVFIDDGCNNPDVPAWAIKLVLQKDEI